MKVVIHHRTQGQGVEAVHLLGMVQGFEANGCAVAIVSPPGVTVGAVAVAHGAPTGDAGGLRRLWRMLADHAPELLFELGELAYNVPAFFRIRRALRGTGASFLYERHAFLNVSGAWAARSLGIPYVVEANYTTATPLYRRRSRLLAPLARAAERSVFRGAAVIAAVSSRLRDQIVAEGVPSERVLVTTNAADASRFRPNPEGERATRTRLGLLNAKVIGFSGGFFPWHGVDLILEALPRIVSRVPDVAVLLLGDGPQRTVLEARARDAGLGDRVRFLGWVPHDALPEHIAAFDVAVMPDSNEYGSPMKIFEYMAMGKPVVAPRLGPLEDGIVEGATGRLFPRRDVAAFADALIDILANDLRRRDMGANAVRHVLEHHTWDRNAARVLAALPPRAAEGAAGKAARTAD